MKHFFYSLMTDTDNGPLSAVLKPALYAISVMYGLALYVRAFLYRRGMFVSRRVPVKVISVGNLTLGGTGKTPFVITLAGMLERDLKANVSVLIRGYGWDEQAMLKSDMPEIPVLVNESRAKAAMRALKLYGSTVVVLDDGFQHWELARDLDIVLIDSRNPFGNGCLFPRGILRESPDAIKRAHVVVFTKVDNKKADLGGLKSRLLGLNKGLVFVEASHVPKHMRDLKTGRTSPLGELKSKRVILLSSIGDPEYFADTVKNLGAQVIDHLIFADHHNYTQSDISSVLRKCDERSFDMIVTTGKDAVKLSRMHFSFGRYAVNVLEIEMKISSGGEQLLDRLHSLRIG